MATRFFTAFRMTCGGKGGGGEGAHEGRPGVGLNLCLRYGDTEPESGGEGEGMGPTRILRCAQNDMWGRRGAFGNDGGGRGMGSPHSIW